ncbi:hypothetical protein [Vacuolonema iberomarrocanum]|uniref:hypothetical protein n=1 Tax=Vacuolonema iberomarrocanum TaxID=3454632 RepID=UPI0019D83653|nr:hypothetical protein [filamentous cyanobacterium LEGE 07170]
MSKISVADGENAIAFIDEAGRNIKPNTTVKGAIAGFEKELAAFAAHDPSLFHKVSPLLKKIGAGLERAYQERRHHGLVHKELMAFFPDTQTLNQMLLDAFWGDWISDDGSWDNKIPTLQHLAGRLKASLKQDLDMILDMVAEPDSRYRVVKENLTIQIIPRIIRAIAGEQIDVSIAPDGEIQFKKRRCRIASQLRKLQTVFLMDATPDRAKLAENLGLRQNSIVQIASPRPQFTNLNLKIVSGFGKAGRNRNRFVRRQGQEGSKLVETPYTLMQRILALVKKVSTDAIAANPNTKIGILDLKEYIKRYSDLEIAQDARALLTGYHFFDSRNSNRFSNCNILFSVGSPVVNLGEMLAEWHLRHRQSYTVEDAPPEFWADINRQTTAEIIQEIGRSRAQHRQDQEIAHYVLADLSDTQIEAITQYFPGIQIERVEAYSICQEAAPKAVQTKKGICKAFAQAIQRGETPVGKNIAEQVGVTKGRVSQILSEYGGLRKLRKSLIALLNTLNNRTKLYLLREEDLEMAQAFFPALLQDLECGRSPSEVLTDFVCLAESYGSKHFEAMLSALPVDTLCTLLRVFLSLLPPDFLRGLSPPMEAIAS